MVISKKNFFFRNHKQGMLKSMKSEKLCDYSYGNKLKWNVTSGREVEGTFMAMNEYFSSCREQKSQVVNL